MCPCAILGTRRSARAHSDFAELSHRMGLAARARVETVFSLRASVATAERALEELLVDGTPSALREDVAEVGSRHA